MEPVSLKDIPFNSLLRDQEALPRPDGGRGDAFQFSLARSGAETGMPVLRPTHDFQFSLARSGMATLQLGRLPIILSILSCEISGEYEISKKNEDELSILSCEIRSRLRKSID